MSSVPSSRKNAEKHLMGFISSSIPTEKAAQILCCNFKKLF
jgi:hypothetical protein